MRRELAPAAPAPPGELTLADEALEVRCAPAHGFLISSILDRASGAEALWRRPAHEPAPAVRFLGAAGSASVETFLDLFAGGWFAMFPDVGYPLAGDPASFLHGEIVRLPWEVVSAGPRHVAARVRTLRRPFAVERRLELDGGRLRIDERIVNVGAMAAPFAWGHHPCFARATFAGGRIELAPSAAEVPAPPHVPGHNVLAPGERFAWPRAPRADGGVEDLGRVPVRPDGRVDHACLTVPDGRLRLVAPRHGRALRLDWDAELFPYVLLWQDMGENAPFPLWGGGDTFALEFSTIPGRSAADALAADALRTLAPGATLATAITLVWEDAGDER